MSRDTSGFWTDCGMRSVRYLAIALGTALVVVGATATVWSQAAPAELPDGALSGIIVPVEIDPAAPKPVAKPAPSAPAPQAARPAPPTSLAPDLLPEEAARAKAIVPADVRPSSFQGLIPGVTRQAAVTDQLGDPIRVQETGSQSVLSFKIGPFPSVDVTLQGDVVVSILAHLAAPGARDDVVKELKLGGFHSTPVADDAGQVLGEVYPERGLTLVYASGSRPSETPLVSDVELEKISPEPFLLRAEQDVANRFGASLSDLEMVHQLAPDNAVAYHVESDIHAKCGRVGAALAAARQAVKLDPNRVQYQLAIAELQRRQSRFDVAIQIPKKILTRDDLTPLDEAVAHLELGKVLVTMPPHAYKDAMPEIVAAVKQLSTLAKRPNARATRRAKQLLIDAELWLARTIAHGPWDKRSEVAPQWLASAEKTTRKSIEEKQVARAMLLRVYGTSLECLDTLQGEGDPGKIADAAISLGRGLIAETHDEDSQAALEWQLGVALRHAGEVAYRHGKFDAALHFASNAQALLTSAAKQRAGAPDLNYQLGQVYFLTGSIHAIGKTDHAAAVTWYDKAVPLLKKKLPPLLRDERGRMGDQLVSVGVSFWQEGRRDDAIAVTEQGADRLRQAIEAGDRSKHALVVPLANLADMHKAMGHAEKAHELAAMAASLSPKKMKRSIH